MNKNIHKIVLILGLASIVSVSCDDYLDVVPKGKEVLNKVEQYAELFNNTSIHTYPVSPYSNLIDDIWINPEAMKDPTQIASSIFCYIDPTTYNRRNLVSISTALIYQYSYDRINKICNITLDNIGTATGDEKLRQQTIAEAHAFRAYSYFVLANIYGKPYDSQTAATDLCVPMFEHYSLESRPPQGTVAQIYNLIESDLEAAIPNLSNKPVNCLHFSKAAAYALKAKVHLMKKEFDKAKAAALESYKLNNFVYDFKNISTLTSLVKINQNDENLYFGAVGGIGSLTTLDFGAVSPELAGLFGATYANPNIADCRFTQFISYKTIKTGDAKSADKTVKLDAEYAPAYDVSTTGAKFFCYNSAGLRTTDVILILAECSAREGDYTNMKKYLDEVRSKRIIGYTSATENPTSKTEAVNIVITERRKELMGGFNRWCDLRRLNTEVEFKRTLTRTCPANEALTHIERKTYTLPADSWHWVFPLPLDEFTLWGPGLEYNVPY